MFIFNPQFINHTVYFLTYIVASTVVATMVSKKRKEQASANFLKRNHFSACPQHRCESGLNILALTVLGKPLSYKRAGFVRQSFNVYDTQKLEKASFGNAVINGVAFNQQTLMPFGDAKVVLEVTFHFIQISLW